MAKMTVYHGGYTPVEKPEIRTGRNTKDFGVGFYCTIIKEQAQRWARRYDTKIVSIITIFRITWMVLLRGSSFGCWQSSNTRHIRLRSARKQH